MTAQKCPNCGAFGPPGTAFCAFCGASFATGAGGRPPAPPPGFGPQVGAPGSGFAAPGVNPPTPLERAVEQSALTYLVWGAAVVLAAGFVAIGSSVISGTEGGILTLNPLLVTFTIIGGVLEVIAVAFFTLALRRLATIDPKFSTPSKLAVLLIVGIVILLAIFDPLVTLSNQLTTCINNAGSNSTAVHACATGGRFLAVLLGALLASILALIGVVGLILGIWRLGTRFHNSYFKIGAILLIIPVADLFGGLLIFLAARSARDLRPPGSRF